MGPMSAIDNADSFLKFCKITKKYNSFDLMGIENTTTTIQLLLPMKSVLFPIHVSCTIGALSIFGNQGVLATTTKHYTIFGNNNNNNLFQ